MIRLAPARRRTVAFSPLPGLAALMAAVLPASSPGPRIPLCAGLTIVTAVSQPEGDYESIKTIVSADGRAVTLRFSSERKVGNALQKLTGQRTVLQQDLERSTLFLRQFHGRGAITVPGTTALGTSAAVLQALRATGSAELGVFDPLAAEAPADRRVHPNVWDYEETERIRRVGNGTVQVPVLVNDAPALLPAIEARGDYTGDQADFFFLDDDANPLALRYRVGKDALDVVKLAYRCPATANAPAPRSRLEQALLQTGRADVYSIYFSFDSDQLRPESDSTLKDIGDVLRRHPDWKLAIGGHTDAIGTDAYNLELSRRRAAAVRAALIARFGIDARRLTAAGYGKRSPRDTNATIAGRARNRRVELVRS